MATTVSSTSGNYGMSASDYEAKIKSLTNQLNDALAQVDGLKTQVANLKKERQLDSKS